MPMNKTFVFKSKIDGYARKDELVALALFEVNAGYWFDLDDPAVKQMHRELFGERKLKCKRCEGEHKTSDCPIPPDYDVETSADSPKRRGCCDKATAPQD